MLLVLVVVLVLVPGKEFEFRFPELTWLVTMLVVMLTVALDTLFVDSLGLSEIGKLGFLLVVE